MTTQEKPANATHWSTRNMAAADYKRNGTATLFAALNTLDGKVISLCQERHRHQEWLRFLRLVNDATPDHKQLHLIVDNYATHKRRRSSAKLKRLPSARLDPGAGCRRTAGAGARPLG